MAINRAMLDELGKAKASKKSDFLKDGSYILLVRELLYDDMNSGATFVARVRVLEATSKGDLDPVTKQPVVPNAVGSDAGWVQLPMKFKSAAGNIKAFVLALLGYSEAEVDSTPGAFGDAVSQLIDKKQPGRGMVIRANSYQAATRSGANAGKIQTYFNFSHIADLNTPEKIAERRKDLDAAEPLA